MIYKHALEATVCDLRQGKRIVGYVDKEKFRQTAFSGDPKQRAAFLSKATPARVREGIAPGIGGSLALLLFSVERYEEPHQRKQPLI